MGSFFNINPQGFKATADTVAANKAWHGTGRRRLYGWVGNVSHSLGLAPCLA